jgi:phosphocarrier protein FPr
MVGLVLVSHSRRLAESVRELVLQMTTRDFPLEIASGVGENHQLLGTDAVHIAEVLQEVDCPEGVLVLMDLGSAVLSAQTALELLDASAARPIRLCPAPLVEGAIAAVVCAAAGGTLDEVAREAERGLTAKQQELQPESTTQVAGVEKPASPPITGPTAELVLTVENQHGLHARPAAKLVQAISRFTCSCEVSNLTSGSGPVSGRSLTSLALLQARKGDRLKIVCSGSDCGGAIEAIRERADDIFHEKAEAVPSSSPVVTPAGSETRSLPCSDGIALGPLLMLEAVDLAVTNAPSGTPAEELAKLTAAMQSVKDEIRRLGNAKSVVGQKAILEAQALILVDPVVLTKVESLLDSGEFSAARAWTTVTGELATQYKAMDDPYLRERASDIRDIANRVLRRVQGVESQTRISLPRPGILFTEELLPSEASACDPGTVLGVIAAKGSTTSHSAIILRTLGIPMVVGATGISKADVGRTVALDGATGEVWIDPDEQSIAKLKKRQQLQLEYKNRVAAARFQAAVTLDDTRVEVLANVGNAREAAIAAENGADGVGLLRTEFLFGSCKEAPSEEEQVRALREIYAAIAGPVIVRTLDVGADKPLAFLPQSEERNPFLGVRGIRLSLRSPELFLPHLRAILRSGRGHEIRIMFPMISGAEEARQALRLVSHAHEQLREAGIAHAWPVQCGAMIEVPSAALCSEELAEELDFFSIGTNDLTQYTMAAERGNAELAHLQEALHPAVLRLIKVVVEAAGKRGRHVSVCGDAASDPLAAAIFVGLGICSLSVRPKQAAEIKEVFRKVHLAQLKTIAGEAVYCRDAAAVRSLIEHYLNADTRRHHDPAPLIAARAGDPGYEP